MQPLLCGQNAVFSSCGNYRYVLTRQIGADQRTATFILLNPSTADATRNDPTIRRCIGFARQWGCGRLVVLNLFAVRATKPTDLKRAVDPVGPDNKKWFERMLRFPPPTAAFAPGPLICGWGVHGTFRDQDQTVLGWLAALGVQPVALGVTKDGHPRHPLYVPYTVRPRRFRSRKRRATAKVFRVLALAKGPLFCHKSEGILEPL